MYTLWWCCIHHCVHDNSWYAHVYAASKFGAHLHPHCGKRGNLLPGATWGILHGILWQNEMALWAGSSVVASQCENITWYVMTTPLLKTQLCAYMVHLYRNYSQTTKVFKVAWWMGHYGHASPKRHKAFTNNKWPAKFNLGKMHLKRFRASRNPDDKPTVRYLDKKGRPRFHGNAKLKQSQSLGLRVGVGGVLKNHDSKIVDQIDNDLYTLTFVDPNHTFGIVSVCFVGCNWLHDACLLELQS